MTFEQFIAEGVKLGIRPDMLFDLSRDLQLNTLRNLLIAKGIITEQEFDELISLEFKSKLEMLRQLPQSRPPVLPK